MTCVYTGALVYLVEYGACVRGDVFLLGEDQILIQWGTPGPKCEEQAMQYGTKQPDATHTASIGHGYHHKARGITVVDRTNFRGEFR